MATCDPSTILASAAAYQGLDSQGLRLVSIGSLITRLLVLYPGTDVTPSAVMARGKAMQALSDQDIRNVVYQTLCTINGG